MTTLITSSERNITNEQLEKSIKGYIDADSLELYSIATNFSGHGHYEIEAEYLIDGKSLIIKSTTDNMNLIDAWKSGDNYEDGEDNFESWDDVADTMLRLVNNNLIEEIK